MKDFNYLRHLWEMMENENKILFFAKYIQHDKG